MTRIKSQHEGAQNFILMAILEEGPLNLKELEQKALLFVSHFGHLSRDEISKKALGVLQRFKADEPEEHYHEAHQNGDHAQEHFDIQTECNAFLEKGYLILAESGKYDLTYEGRIEAEKFKKSMEKAGRLLEKSLLNPNAAARNTVIVDLFLAIMKLLVGILSGSVGLIADGADASIDTISAVVVWLGVRFKKETIGTAVIVTMMFFTGISVGYESIGKVIEACFGILEHVTLPFLVIIVELIAMLFALLLTFYQRYVGKKFGSFALISQSIDSKNHIYVAGAVIGGAIFSVFGIHFVDALIGCYVSFKIMKDAAALFMEIIHSLKGVETDLSKYSIPLEKYWEINKLQTFKMWILYLIKEENTKTENEIIAALERTFSKEYIPLLSELKINLGKNYNFRENFKTLVAPLLEQKLLVKIDEGFNLTSKSKRYLSRIFKVQRYHDNA